MSDREGPDHGSLCPGFGIHHYSHRHYHYPEIPLIFNCAELTGLVGSCPCTDSNIIIGMSET